MKTSSIYLQLAITQKIEKFKTKRRERIVFVGKKRRRRRRRRRVQVYTVPMGRMEQLVVAMNSDSSGDSSGGRAVKQEKARVNVVKHANQSGVTGGGTGCSPVVGRRRVECGGVTMVEANETRPR